MKNLNIKYGYKAIHIDTRKKEIYFNNGEVVFYKQVISTIPLPNLIKIIDVPIEIRQASKKLHATSMILISVGFNQKIKFPSLWFYVYDENIPFARVYLPSMKSPDNVPNGCSSLQFEIYYSEEYPMELKKEELIKKH